MNHPFMDIPIPTPPPFSWDAVRAVPIEESGEETVPASLVPEKILVRPQYYHQMLERSVPECYVRRSVLARLLEAADMLPKGCRLVLLDSWRPRSIQTTLFQKFRSELREKMPLLSDAEITTLASQYVAPPSLHPQHPSPHVTGGAVDLTIVDGTGICLPMGSEFDETSERSSTVWFEMRLAAGEALSPDETEAMYNRRLLFYVMQKAGFCNYPDEWWHFDYGDQIWALLSGKRCAIYGVTEPSFRWRQY